MFQWITESDKLYIQIESTKCFDKRKCIKIKQTSLIKLALDLETFGNTGNIS